MKDSRVTRICGEPQIALGVLEVQGRLIRVTRICGEPQIARVALEVEGLPVRVTRICGEPQIAQESLNNKSECLVNVRSCSPEFRQSYI